MGKTITLNIERNRTIDLGIKRGSSGSNSYNALFDKPQINSVTLIGNKTSEELHLQGAISDITEQDIDQIMFG